MDKLIMLVPGNNGKLFVEIDSKKHELKSSLIISSWDQNDTDWFWKLTVENPKQDHKSGYTNQVVVPEMYNRDELVYAGRDIIVGYNGTGVVLTGGSRPYMRPIDASTARFMRAKGIETVERRLPDAVRFRAFNQSTILNKVFDLDGNEQKPVAGDSSGSFILDPEKPWIVEHKKVAKSLSYTWKGLYIPKGWRYQPITPKSETQPAPAPAVNTAPAKQKEFSAEVSTEPADPNPATRESAPAEEIPATVPESMVESQPPVVVDEIPAERQESEATPAEESMVDAPEVEESPENSQEQVPSEPVSSSTTVPGEAKPAAEAGVALDIPASEAPKTVTSQTVLMV